MAYYEMKEKKVLTFISAHKPLNSRSYSSFSSEVHFSMINWPEMRPEKFQFQFQLHKMFDWAHFYDLFFCERNTVMTNEPVPGPMTFDAKSFVCVMILRSQLLRDDDLLVRWSN